MKNIAVTMLLCVAAPAMGAPVMQHASGTFAVKIEPQASDSGDGVTVSRMTVNKVFSGGLVGTGKGDMLATGSGVDSGAYVLIERVTGTLAGKAGSFALMHHATVVSGKPDQHIIVVPGSGSGGLAGLSGDLTMRVEGGTHFYDLAYSIAPK